MEVAVQPQNVGMSAMSHDINLAPDLQLHLVAAKLLLPHGLDGADEPALPVAHEGNSAILPISQVLSKLEHFHFQFQGRDLALFDGCCSARFCLRRR